MSIQYTCKDMGLNCAFVVRGDKLEDITKKALEHVLEKHVADFNIIQSPEEIVQMEQALARSTRQVPG